MSAQDPGHRPGRYRERPPWWPEGEPFPVQGVTPRMSMHPRSMAKIAFAFMLAVILAIVGAFTVLWTIATGLGMVRPTDGPGPWPTGVVVLLIVVAVSSLVRRTVRGVAVPVGDLIAAAGRVEAGGYDARVPERGPRQMRSVARAFNAMTVRLEAHESQRRQLLADVTHELRNPLTVMQGNIEALIDGVHPTDAAHLELILDESKVLARLIDDLRTLSLAEAGALALVREPIDVATVAKDVLAASVDRARRAGVDLRPVEAGTAMADADPLRVREVLSNLVGNSLRYTPSGGSISIGLRAGTMVEVSVRDTGAGIAPEALAHVFERYSRSTDSPGAGLGLAIAKSLIEAHGGTIRAESADGQGTRVVFTLPGTRS